MRTSIANCTLYEYRYRIRENLRENLERTNITMKQLIKTGFSIIIILTFIIPLAACRQEENEENGETTFNPVNPRGITQEDFNVDKATLERSDESDEFSDWFINENGIEFVFNRETGMLVRIFAPTDIILTQPDQAVLSMEEMEQLADEIISHFADLNVLTRSHWHADYGGLAHDFSFARIIDGFVTHEMGTVRILNSGDVLNAGFFNAGMFDNITLPPIDLAAIDREFAATIRQEISAGIVAYQIEDRALTIIDGRLYMTFGFVYRTEFSYEDEYSELQSTAVPIPN